MYGHHNLAHWLSALSRESKQWSVIGLEIGLFEIESVK
jgi:hypothetical protein